MKNIIHRMFLKNSVMVVAGFTVAGDFSVSSYSTNRRISTLSGTAGIIKPELSTRSGTSQINIDKTQISFSV
jgi:hypothetical protein